MVPKPLVPQDLHTQSTNVDVNRMMHNLNMYVNEKYNKIDLKKKIEFHIYFYKRISNS